MVESFALSLKWHEGIALGKERSRRRLDAYCTRMIISFTLLPFTHDAMLPSYELFVRSIVNLFPRSLVSHISCITSQSLLTSAPRFRLELLDQWVDGSDRSVCVEPAPKYNASAPLADRRTFNPSVSALAATHPDDDGANVEKAAAEEGAGATDDGEDANQKKAAAEGGRRSAAVQSSKERQAESRKRKAQQLYALKQGATCVTATVNVGVREFVQTKPIVLSIRFTQGFGCGVSMICIMRGCALILHHFIFSFSLFSAAPPNHRHQKLVGLRSAHRSHQSARVGGRPTGRPFPRSLPRAALFSGSVLALVCLYGRNSSTSSVLSC